MNVTQLKERVAAVADREAKQCRCVGMVMQVLGMIAYIEMRPSIRIDEAEMAKLEQQVRKLEAPTTTEPQPFTEVRILN